MFELNGLDLDYRFQILGAAGFSCILFITNLVVVNTVIGQILWDNCAV